MSGVPFRGVSSAQDARFVDNQRKLLKSLAKTFPPEFNQKPDLSRVNWDSIKPWISSRITELLGVEDDILISYVEEQVIGKKDIDPRMLQINLTGFLEKNTPTFCKELWDLLLSASQTSSGIPQQFLDEQAEERRKHKEEQRRYEERMYKRDREHDHHRSRRRYDDDDDHYRNRRRYDDDDDHYRNRRRYDDDEDDRRYRDRRNRDRSISPRDDRRHSRRRDRSRSRDRYHRRRRSYSRSVSRERRHRHRSNSRERRRSPRDYDRRRREYDDDVVYHAVKKEEEYEVKKEEYEVKTEYDDDGVVLKKEEEV